MKEEKEKELLEKITKTAELQELSKKRYPSNDTVNNVINNVNPIKSLALDFTILKINLTKAAAEKLTIVNPRKMHNGQVNSIYQGLLKGKHFDSIFVVNNLNNVTRIIDGNHRLQACKTYFEKYPDAKISLYFATYYTLNEDQEREIFTRWNISISQSTDDFINSYKETIPMFHRFVSELPCNVYGSSSKMKLRDLVNAYNASFENPYKGGESKTKLNLILHIQKLDNNDLDQIVENFNIIREIFDNENKKDWRNQAPFKNIIFRALYYIVANNKETLGLSYIKRRMRSVLFNRTILDEYRRYSGRRASVDAYLAFLKLLNDTQSDKKFV